MAHEPLKMTIPETQFELDRAWSRSYSPERNKEAIDSLRDHPVSYRVIHLVMRLFFRGIYFPQMNKRAWFKVILQNRRSILSLSKDAYKGIRASRKNKKSEKTAPSTVMDQQKAA